MSKKVFLISFLLSLTYFSTIKLFNIDNKLNPTAMSHKYNSYTVTYYDQIYSVHKTLQIFAHNQSEAESVAFTVLDSTLGAYSFNIDTVVLTEN